MKFTTPSRSFNTPGTIPAILGLTIALLQVSTSAFAEPDTEPPTLAMTGVNISKLSGANHYRFEYSITANDNVGIAELEIHGAVAGGEFDAWRAYPYYEGIPIEIILQCYEFRFEVRAKDLNGNYSVPAGHHFIAEPGITSSLKTKGKVGKNFVYRIQSPTADRYTCSKLPDGLKLNEKTGKISGIPRKSGRYKITMSAINVSGTGMSTLQLKIGD